MGRCVYASSVRRRTRAGERFGALTVTEVGLRYTPTPSQVSSGRQGDWAALCECDCQRASCVGSRLVKLGDLRTGRVGWCSSGGKLPRRVEVGQRFGALTATEVNLRQPPTPSQAAVGGLGDRAVLCRCHCGQPDCSGPRQVRVHDLFAGRVTKCGAGGQEATRRRGRQPPVTEPYGEVVADFLKAVVIDVSYAERMAYSASLIVRKRLAWAVRIRLRDAETEAVALCRKSQPFVCSSPSPCGVGPECKFARGDLAELLGVPSFPPRGGYVPKGRSLRPQVGPDGFHGSYSVESAVQPLMASAV